MLHSFVLLRRLRLVISARTTQSRSQTPGLPTTSAPAGIIVDEIYGYDSFSVSGGKGYVSINAWYASLCTVAKIKHRQKNTVTLSRSRMGYVSLSSARQSRRMMLRRTTRPHLVYTRHHVTYAV